MTGPSPNGSYDLTTSSDNFSMPSGLLAGLPNGLLALDGNDTVRGSADPETMFGNQGDDSLLGGGANDLLLGGKGKDFLSGDDSNDILGGNLGEDYLVGGAGSDTLQGGKGGDILVGGDGADVLSGDRDADLLAGNAGADLFVLKPEMAETSDLILDFDKSSDRIGLTGGKTQADLLLEQKNLPLNEALGSVSGQLSSSGVNVPPEFLTPEFIRQGFALLTGADIDPNGDGQISGTSIKIAATGQELGFAVNVTPADLTGLFVNY